MSHATSIPKQRMRTSPAAEALSPAECRELRALLSQARKTPVLDEYLDVSEVAKRLDLHPRTVRDLARAGEFDGEWGQAWKPAPNRLRIPVRGVLAFTAARAAKESA